MKKFTSYGLMLLGILVLGFVVVFAGYNQKKKFNHRLSLRQRDKIPYGMYVAKNLLQETFSKAHTYYDKSLPPYFTNEGEDTSGQLAVLVGRNFIPDVETLKQLQDFIQKGNTVFIITNDLGTHAARYLNVSVEGDTFFSTEDTLRISLAQSSTDKMFEYPGLSYASYFSKWDSTVATPLGYSVQQQPNLLRWRSGKGQLFIHLAPLAFSNYFLLHKNNIAYFKELLSFLPDDVHTIIWNEYYVDPYNQQQKEPGFLRVLWKHEALRWALITAGATLLLYVLSGMRRRQRIIPPYAKPANESLNFVQTIGRLYFDRGDHHDLAKKMTAYFLDHLRTRYKIHTLPEEEGFAEEVTSKTGYGHEDLKKITDFITYIRTYDYITEDELSRYYYDLHHFYKQTYGATV